MKSRILKIKLRNWITKVIYNIQVYCIRFEKDPHKKMNRLNRASNTLNHRWNPSQSNHSQYKYYPYFDGSQKAINSLNQKFCLQSKEWSEYFAKNELSKSIYEDYFGLNNDIKNP